MKTEGAEINRDRDRLRVKKKRLSQSSQRTLRDPASLEQELTEGGHSCPPIHNS